MEERQIYFKSICPVFPNPVYWDLKFAHCSDVEACVVWGNWSLQCELRSPWPASYFPGVYYPPSWLRDPGLWNITLLKPLTVVPSSACASLAAAPCTCTGVRHSTFLPHPWAHWLHTSAHTFFLVSNEVWGPSGLQLISTFLLLTSPDQLGNLRLGLC